MFRQFDFRYFLVSIALLFVFAIKPNLVHSQSIASPRLTCIVNDFVGSNVSITWQNVANSCGPFVSYTLYGSNTKTGPYSVITTINTQSQTTFVHSGALSINPTWFYYMEANFNCPGFTPSQSDTIQNESNPLTPAILSVSANQDGNVTFSWQPSTSPQTKFYIIYAYLPNGGIVPIDTVFGRFTTSYIDSIQDPSIQSVGYTIAAGDSCVGNQPSAFNTSPQQSTFLETTVARCLREVKLKWNKYINFPQGVLRYEIWVNKNLAGYAKVGETDSSTTNFPFTDFSDNDSICVSIGAVSAADSNVIAFSNYVCQRPSIVQPPDFVYIKRLSVTPDNNVEIDWMTDPKAELLTHELLRTEDCATYLSIKNLRVTPPFVLDYAYADSTALTQETSYCYEIKAVDSCQGERISPKGKTIFLQAELTDYYEIKLDWNSYELFGATVQKYHLYRNYGTGWQLIQTFGPTVNSYKDSLYQFLSERGEFCYYIEAEYDFSLPDVPFTGSLQTTSNRVCLFHRPIIYIPNAFVPEGVNNIFKPTIFFGDPANYRMTIFNRYGGRIFETTNPTQGWDGTDGGKLAIQGGYAYLISFIAADGTKVERKGIVLLVRN